MNTVRAAHRLRFPFLLAVVAGIVACGDGEEISSADEDIVGGRNDTRFSPVGYLALDADRTGAHYTLFCTATLIAPKVVATAAHCVHETKLQTSAAGPYITFATGAAKGARTPSYARLVYEDPLYDPLDPAYSAKELYAHDFALLVLDDAVPGVTPAKIAPADPSRPYLAVGYGRTKTGPYDLVEPGPPKRKSLAMSLVGGTPDTYYVVDPKGGAGAVCYGDSGGPLLQVGGTGKDVVVVGVLATMFGDDPNKTCVPGTRTAYSSFVAEKALVDQVLAVAGRQAAGPP